jgi:hypothetical protein
VDDKAICTMAVPKLGPAQIKKVKVKSAAS